MTNTISGSGLFRRWVISSRVISSRSFRRAHFIAGYFVAGYVSSQERGWKEHFEEHLNEGSKSEQPTRPVDLRDDRVDIDLPSREEIEGALKYLKKQQGSRR
jgi:hypothetical protein